MRRITSCLPHDSILWACLRAPASLPSILPRVVGAEPRCLHWRLAGTSLDYFYRCDVQASAMADRLVKECGGFRPEVIWALPELEAVAVATLLASRFGVPVHATVFDAPKTARRVCLPWLYYQWHRRAVRRLLRDASSVDAVSDELVEHLRSNRYLSPSCETQVIPPSVPSSWVLPPVSVAALKPRMETARRIAVCGSLRSSRRQWETFLSHLGMLPFPVEILAFAWSDSMHRDVHLPATVSLIRRPYLESEQDLIRALRGECVDAGYLGLNVERQWRTFAATSLSSKLVTYAAAGIPIIVDGPKDSVAWRLVMKYEAGVRWDFSPQTTDDRPQVGEGGERDAVERLLCDQEVWLRAADGARRMCLSEFCLDSSVTKLCGMLTHAAERKR